MEPRVVVHVLPGWNLSEDDVWCNNHVFWLQNA
jgi:hypothetical protein